LRAGRGVAGPLKEGHQTLPLSQGSQGLVDLAKVTLDGAKLPRCAFDRTGRRSV